MDNTSSSNSEFHADWFRQTSPYINAHRDKTFVVYFSGEMLESDAFPTLVHDITLLRSLGVRLVLVHGLRKQIDRRLAESGIKSVFVNGRRLTDTEALDVVVGEAGRARIRIEAQLSTGLPNTPMSGAHLTVASGNFITAQPVGVLNGTDYLCTGLVRQVHARTIQRQIDTGHLVLLSPLGYSKTGELFNVEAEDVAMRTAAALKADKLIYLTDQLLTQPDADGKIIYEISHADLEPLLQMMPAESATRLLADKSVNACRAGVNRVHILDYRDPDALLKELFTRDGCGTMINADDYEIRRPARINDVGGIIELIEPLETSGMLVKRSRESLEVNIQHFQVIERDGMIIACGAMFPFSEQRAGEIACIATHTDYRNGGRAERLLRALEKQARNQQINTLFVMTTQTGHWFQEQGFATGSLDDLPENKQNELNLERNSKALFKSL